MMPASLWSTILAGPSRCSYSPSTPRRQRRGEGRGNGKYGRVTYLSDDNTHACGTGKLDYVTECTYDEASNLLTEKNVRLQTITYQYNGVGLVSDMAVSGESSFTYSYNAANQLKRVESFGAGNFTTTSRYDSLYRMTEETKRDSGGASLYSLLYGYDSVGNRTTRTLDGTTVTYTYDDNDKLTSTSGGGQSASFGYDNNGIMTSVSGTMFGSRTLVYDDENQLTSLLSGGVTDLYYYNALGQRYRARLGGTYWRYVYDGDRVLEETNDSGTAQARYTTADQSYFSPLLHMWRTPSTSRFPLYDMTGSARELVDAAGAVTDTYTRDAFGRQISSMGSTTTPYKCDAARGELGTVAGFLAHARPSAREWQDGTREGKRSDCPLGIVST